MTGGNTPGPWHTYATGRYIGIRGAGRIQVAQCWTGKKDTQQMEANAALISAAPDLLAALYDCVEDSEEAVAQYIAVHGETHRPRRLQAMRDTVEKARAAIAKAEGRAS